MKILLISFYYKPDLSVGAFRATSLVKALLENLPDNGHIDVITTKPNRYSSFSKEAPKFETSSNLSIHRILLPHHDSGMLDQSRAFIKFAIKTIKLCDGKKYDLIFATSSRLMTAALGAYISKKLKRPFYLDLRDIFVDAIKDVFSKKLLWMIGPIFSGIEKWTIKSANKVNLVSKGFLPYFQKHYPKQKYSFYSNGIDNNFIKFNSKKVINVNKKFLKAIYAGNIGIGQGLHEIIPLLAKRYEKQIHFKIIGDGGRKQQLANAIKSFSCSNVEIIPPVKRNELIKLYLDADILFLHLNNYEHLKKVLPSKLFEYAAMGKPIWAGLAGYSAKFTKKNIINASVFKPCDVKDATLAFDRLDIKTYTREDFIKNFSRDVIMKKMAHDVISIAKVQ